MNIDYRKHAKELAETVSALQAQVLEKYTAAIIEEMHDQIVKRDTRIKELESGINQLSCNYEHTDRVCTQCGWLPPITVTIQTTQN